MGGIVILACGPEKPSSFIHEIRFDTVNLRSIASFLYGTRVLGMLRICAADLRARASGMPTISHCYFLSDQKVTKKSPGWSSRPVVLSLASLNL